jgi:cyanophycin synthetase
VAVKNENNQEFRIYFGPSLVAPFAAAVVEFTPDFVGTRAPAELARALHELMPPELKLTIAWPETPLGLAELAALIASGFQDLRGPNHLPHESAALGNGRMRVTAGFYNADAAIMALRGAVGLAHAVFARFEGSPVDRKQLVPFLKQTAAMSNYQPDYVARALMRVARKRGIPVAPLASGTAMWIYGEGIKALHFMEAANHRDSPIGMRLSGDKFRVAELLRALGLPTTEQMLAHTPQQAVQAARRLGFPVVVKPLRGSKGRGVSIGLDDDAAIAAAFGKARDTSTDPVLIERFVEGDDYRLSVFGGKLLRASRFDPPHVIGDGVTDIARLIDAENNSRNQDDIASGLIIRIAIDSDTVTLLRQQGLSLSDIPPLGTRVWLRRNANLATGGTLEEVTDRLHPDNRVMAETIARALHLDAVGIDFMTTDPSRSWRDGNAAVIEVNAVPGISDVLAERIMAQKFTGNGRIPSILIIGSDQGLSAAVSTLLAEKGLSVGEATPEATRLGSERRFRSEVALPERIRALLLDPACEALVVIARPDEIALCGLPYAKFSLAIIAEPISEELSDLIVTHVAHVLNSDVDRTILSSAVESALTSEGRA